MRNNQPVTQQEFDFPDDVTLMSTTDADSIITYANTTFAQVSGFTNEELVGQPHNVVRPRTCRARRLPTCGRRSSAASRGPRS